MLSFLQKMRVKAALRKPIPEFRLAPVDSYAPVRVYEDTVEYSIRNAMCGVHVFSLPRSSGKTIVAQRVANKLFREHHTSGTVYVSLYTDVGSPGERVSISSVLAAKLGVDGRLLFNQDSALSLLPADATAGKPVVFIVDDADAVIAGDEHLCVDLAGLAATSVLGKRFCVLLLLGPDTARLVCSWNGGQKIRLASDFRGANARSFRPTEKEIDLAVLKQDLRVLSRDDVQMFQRLCRRVRSVGFVAEGAGRLKAIAAMRAAEEALLLPSPHSQPDTVPMDVPAVMPGQAICMDPQPALSFVETSLHDLVQQFEGGWQQWLRTILCRTPGRGFDK